MLFGCVRMANTGRIVANTDTLTQESMSGLSENS